MGIDLSSEEPTILEPVKLEVTIDSHWGAIHDGTLDLETGPAIQVLGTSQRAVSVDKGERWRRSSSSSSRNRASTGSLRDSTPART
jgi:hypothetical protein